MIPEATGTDSPMRSPPAPPPPKLDAAILPTDGSSQSSATAAYLAAHPGDVRWALGGPAAAADPTATPIVGDDRFDTSAKVAAQFFTNPAAIAVASGVKFPDALSGGAHIGMFGGPLLLVNPDVPLPEPVRAYFGEPRQHRAWLRVRRAAGDDRRRGQRGAAGHQRRLTSTTRWRTARHPSPTHDRATFRHRHSGFSVSYRLAPPVRVR